MALLDGTQHLRGRAGDWRKVRCLGTQCRRLGEFIGDTVTACGLVVEQRIHHQITGEPMKFLSLADWTGIIETELFSQTYKSYGLATVRYPVLEIEARIEPYENQRGFSLRALRAGKPRCSGGLRPSPAPALK